MMIGAIQVLRNAVGCVSCGFIGPFKCYVPLFSWKFEPPPRNANNVEPFTFVTLFSGES